MHRVLLPALLMSMVTLSAAGAQERDWSGLWLGVGVGGAHATVEASHDDGTDFCISETSGDDGTAAAAACQTSANTAVVKTIATAGDAAAANSALALDDAGTATADASMATQTSAGSQSNSGTSTNPETAGVAFLGSSTGPGSYAESFSIAFADTVEDRYAAMGISHAEDGNGQADAFAAAFLNVFDIGTMDRLTTGGLMVGGEVRYDHQFGQVVVGAALDAMVAGDLGSAAVTQVADFGAGLSHEVTTGARKLASARLRLGLSQGDVLPYVTGGIAVGELYARARESVSILGYEQELVSGEETKTAIAGVVGGGVSLWLGDGVVLTAEGLYYMFDDMLEVDGGPVRMNGIATGTLRMSFKLH